MSFLFLGGAIDDDTVQFPYSTDIQFIARSSHHHRLTCKLSVNFLILWLARRASPSP